MTNASSLTARWGLLLTVLLLGAALVATGFTNYFDARRAATSTARVEGNDLLQLRHDLRDAGAVDARTLERLLEASRPRGVRFIGVVTQAGLLSSAGTPGADVTWQRPGPEQRTGSGPPPTGPVGPARDAAPPPGGGPPPQDREDRASGDGDPNDAPRPTPPLQRLPGTSLYRAVAWLEPPPDPRRELTPADRRGPLAPEHAILVVDFEPVIAARMVSRALVALIAQVATTGILLLAAISFWRTSDREEAARRVAERDRHLRTLGEMSAVLGHELRNPLTSLKGHAQLLVERLPSDHPGRGAATTIVGEAIRLEALANQVLEFVKTGTLNIQNVDPRAVVSEARDLCGVDGVLLNVGHVPSAWLQDRARLVAVLVNLLKNAREASPPGSPIELRASVDQGRLVYEVLDRGEGLPPGNESRTFEPFFTTRVHGTGLGLALAKRVVESHGGTIRATNREGGGAGFRIDLPRHPMRAA